MKRKWREAVKEKGEEINSVKEKVEGGSEGEV